MFRLRGTPLLLSVAGLGLALSGCHHMIYREMYSPRKKYFVPPVEKAPVMPPEKKTPAMPGSTPEAGALPAVPLTPPAGPAIPGLEPAPPAAPPAPPAM